MAINKDEIITESIVGLIVGVGMTVITLVPVGIYYGVSNWWNNRKVKKQISKTLDEVNRENAVQNVIDKMDQYSVVEFNFKNES